MTPTPFRRRLTRTAQRAAILVALLVSTLGIVNFGFVLWVWLERTPAKIVPACDALGVVMFAVVALCIAAAQAFFAWQGVGDHAFNLSRPAKQTLVGSMVIQVAFVLGGVLGLFPEWTLEFVQGHTVMLLLGIGASLLLLSFGKSVDAVSRTA